MNFNITDMQAAVGCAKLKKFSGFVESRRHNFEMLLSGLQEVQDKFILPEPCPGSKPSWFGFLLTCREGVQRERVVRYLEEHGIQTRMLFAGNLIKHPCFDELRRTGDGYRVVGSLEYTDRLMNDTFWVGVYPGLTEAKLTYMIESIRKAVGVV